MDSGLINFLSQKMLRLPKGTQPFPMPDRCKERRVYDLGIRYWYYWVNATEYSVTAILQIMLSGKEPWPINPHH